MPEAVFLDLFETLVTEFDPTGKPPSIAWRLRVDESAFRTEWPACQEKRWIGAYPGFPSILQEIDQLVSEVERSFSGQREGEAR